MATDGYVAPDGVTLQRVVAAGSVFWVAIARRRGQSVVVKRLTPRMRREPRAHDAVEREVAALKRARHPALPTLIGHGTDGHGPFVIETFARGTSLAELATLGPMPPPLLEQLATAAFSALGEIHDLSDDHGPLRLALGDVSPEDVIIGKQPGTLWFVDLGQASWRDQPSHPDARGTPPFSPPNVVSGDSWSQASDVYALAAILVFAATGVLPCRATGPSLLVEIAERGLSLDGLKRVEGLRSGFVGALERATAFADEDRLSTAAEVLDALVAR